ncbi:MAG: decarboxylase protein [Gammaproteobacteria bacterium]|jgi:HCOMODA/2-hydroxy-3-carboxy-muconic semialdehyde decarboxylase|nr:decarboxylase protein [Gammaproteobacteria bacterium]
MADPVQVSTADARRVRVAARALARAGLVHAYGHCSLRIDADHFIVSPPKPLGLVGAEDVPVIVHMQRPLPADALPEVLAHQYIYRQRGDVHGIARFQSPHLTALSTLGLTPRARHGFGAYFGPGAPLHEDPRLVRDSASAQTLVGELGAARAVVMRGNGAVAVGASIEEAIVMAWYLEDSARVELAVLGTGLEGRVLTLEETKDRAVTSGRIVERMWDWLTAGDPEHLC